MIGFWPDLWPGRHANSSFEFAVRTLGLPAPPALHLAPQEYDRDAEALRVFGRQPPVASTDATPTSVCDDRRVRPTVVIVDDHAEFRAAARALLEAEGFDVIGEAGDAAEALAVAARLLPQVVLLDIQLPDRDGFAVAEELVDGPSVVLTSSHEAAAYGRRLETAPVRGFIAKRELSGEALAALMP